MSRFPIPHTTGTGRRLGVVGFLLAMISCLIMAPTAVAAPADKTPPVGMNALGMSPNDDSVTVAIIRANEKAAFDYFVAKGLTTVQAAGVIGNLDQESGMDPTISELSGGPGRGIAQWSAGGRWDTYAGDN
ncbi:MAG: phage tail tip lysozyme, partial [Propionibacteriales bacterium]|nr:phage tail tip lysozyme [Propionibacteriales bacterium]